MKRKRVKKPDYIENPVHDLWGNVIRPSFPYHIKDLFQGFRDGLILKELVFLRCNSCKREFAIFVSFCAKEISCPYCTSRTSYIEDRGKFLFRLCSQLIGKLKIEHARKKAAEDS